MGADNVRRLDKIIENTKESLKNLNDNKRTIIINLDIINAQISALEQNLMMIQEVKKNCNYVD